MRQAPEAIFEGIGQHARQIMRQYFEEASCIPATRIIIKVLAHYGIRALPLPVECMVMSSQFTQYIRSGKKWPQSLAEWQALGSDFIAVCVGGVPGRVPGRQAVNPHDPSDTTTWAGHLVAWVPLGEGGLVIDGSIDQANQLGHGLHLPGVVMFAAERAFRFGSMQQGMITADGTVLQYEAVPSNTEGYLTSDYWTKSDAVMTHVAQRIIAAIEGQRPARGVVEGIEDRLRRARSHYITGSKL